MNARASQLVPINAFHTSLSSLANQFAVDAILGVKIPTNGLDVLIGGDGRSTLTAALSGLYNYCRTAGRFTDSGGFVVASKLLHCLYPDLAPMIDGQHTGISYYNIVRVQYLPPSSSWVAYIGYQPKGVPNPSPRGAGRHSWQSHQFLCAIGVSETIYTNWQVANNNPGLSGFLGLDKTPGTTGVPRVLDKVLW